MTYQIYNFHDFPVCYRCEHRKGGDALILSYRGPDGTGKLEFEDAPHRLPKQCCGDINTALEVLTPRFLEKYFDLNDKDGEARRKHISLPLAAVWVADHDKVQQLERWSSSTMRKYSKSFEFFVAKHGSEPFTSLTPATCVSTLEQFSQSNHENCIRLLRALFALQQAHGILKDNPWDNYVPTVHRTETSYTKLLALNLRDNMLTALQRETLIRTCLSKVGGRGGYRYFAVLLLLILGLSLQEVCALKYRDFSWLEFYPSRLVIHLTQVYTQLEGYKGYSYLPYKHPYQMRTVPVATVIGTAYQRLCAHTKGSIVEQEDLPLVRSSKNRRMPMTPKQLRKWLNSTFRPEFQSQESAFGSKQSFDRLLSNTAKRNLERIGYEEEEIRHQLGLTPILTSAKHYCDFSNEAELNKLGLLQDLLISQLDDVPALHTDTFDLKAKDDFKEWSIPGHRCGVSFTLSIPPVSQEFLEQNKGLSNGITLQLSARQGLDAVITHELYKEV